MKKDENDPKAAGGGAAPVDVFLRKRYGDVRAIPGRHLPKTKTAWERYSLATYGHGQNQQGD